MLFCVCAVVGDSQAVFLVDQHDGFSWESLEFDVTVLRAHLHEGMSIGAHPSTAPAAAAAASPAAASPAVCRSLMMWAPARVLEVTCRIVGRKDALRLLHLPPGPPHASSCLRMPAGLSCRRPVLQLAPHRPSAGRQLGWAVCHIRVQCGHEAAGRFSTCLSAGTSHCSIPPGLATPSIAVQRASFAHLLAGHHSCSLQACIGLDCPCG